MGIVIDVIGPVFGIVILGYAAARTGLFSAGAADGLARFVFDFAIPIFLFWTFATNPLPETFPIGLFVSFYGSAFAVFGIGILIARYVFKRDMMGAILSGFACAFGNSIQLGLPLTLRAFGDEGAVPMFLILSVHGLSLFVTTTVLLELAKNSGGALSGTLVRILRGVTGNPIILGLVAGLSVNLAGITLPGLVDDIGRLMRDAAVPGALFAMGATLARYGFAGRLSQTMVVILLKMAVFPLSTWLLATRVFDLDPLWAMVATLMAAQPSGVNVYLFANRYDTAKAIASSTVFLSTAVSIFSISVLLYLFETGAGQ